MDVLAAVLTIVTVWFVFWLAFVAAEAAAREGVPREAAPAPAPVLGPTAPCERCTERGWGGGTATLKLLRRGFCGEIMLMFRFMCVLMFCGLRRAGVTL